MQRAMSVSALVVGGIGMGWVLLFWVLIAYKVWESGDGLLGVVAQVERAYWIRLVVAGLVGSVFLALGITTRGMGRG